MSVWTQVQEISPASTQAAYSLYSFLAPHHHHSTPLLEKLLWLPISESIKYKVACMCFSAINGSGPANLSELLYGYTPSRTCLLYTSDAADER